MIKRSIMVISVVALLLLAGCGRGAETGALRVAVLPILDSLPLYVAEAEGYFAERGIDVELVPVASAAERDQLLQADQVDGIITDLVALVLYNRDAVAGDPAVVAVRYAMTPSPEHAQFRILAAADTGITSVGDLRGVPIGISEGTVIEYVTQRILTAEGLAAGEIETLAVPKIPDRMALLGSGELRAATLPEPLASLAVQQGGVVIVDDTEHMDASCSLYAFRASTLDVQPEVVRAFLDAVDEASAAINADKARWDDLLAAQGLVPPSLAGQYRLPDYPGRALPTQSQFADVVAWLQVEGRLEMGPTYGDVVRR